MINGDDDNNDSFQICGSKMNILQASGGSPFKVGQKKKIFS